MSQKQFWAGIVFIILVLTALLNLPKTAAQDLAQPIVCRDADYGYGSFVIRIPAEWNNPDLASWSVLADGFGSYDDVTPDVYRADALTKVEVYGEGYPDWYKYIAIGNVLVFNGDYTFIGVYNQDTPVCDDNDFPVAPVEQTPTPTPDATCSAIAINSANGKAYCYVPQANGVVPIPPAS